MKLIWVKGSLPLSKFIMWGLNEPVSHFAIVFDDKIVFHSDLMGVRIAWYPTFLKTHEIVFEKSHDNLKLDIQEEIYQSIITNFDGSSYDYGAFLYFIWRGLLNKLFNIPFPMNNKLQSNNKYLCTELIKVLPDYIVPAEIKNLDLSLCSPYKLWKLMQESSKV